MGKIGIYSFNIFKTINAGDGGMLVTDDDSLYFRAFGYHDQGHFPSRSGVEIGNRSIVGQNYRMNEIDRCCSDCPVSTAGRHHEAIARNKGAVQVEDRGITGPWLSKDQ